MMTQHKNFKNISGGSRNDAPQIPKSRETVPLKTAPHPTSGEKLTRAHIFCHILHQKCSLTLDFDPERPADLSSFGRLTKARAVHPLPLKTRAFKGSGF
jgi:hypothetical protein